MARDIASLNFDYIDTMPNQLAKLAGAVQTAQRLGYYVTFRTIYREPPDATTGVRSVVSLVASVDE